MTKSVYVGQAMRDLAGTIRVFLLIERIDQLYGGVEAHVFTLRVGRGTATVRI